MRRAGARNRRAGTPRGGRGGERAASAPNTDVIPSKRAVLLTALKLLDLSAVVVCYAAASLAVAPERELMSVEEILAMRIRLVNIVLFAAFLLVWYVVFRAFGVYRSSRLTSRWSEVSGILRATAVASALIYALSRLSGIALVRGEFLTLFFVAISAVTVASRLALRWALGVVRRRGRNLRHALIVGTNPRAVVFARKLEAKPELGYRVVGFLDRREWDVSGDFERSGYALVGAVGDLPDLLRREVVDEVMVFLPIKSFYELGSRIVDQCAAQGIPVTFPTTLFRVGNARLVGEDEADPVVTIATGSMTGAAAALKRVLDVIIASILLVALAPLLLAVAAGIRLTSPGPAFFAQERVGLNKRRFRMLKFRTMVADAEKRMKELEHLNEVSGPVFKIRNDPRVTPLGAILRKTSIDELPQLLNVLRGDLSLVGPRPLPVRDYEGFDKDHHRRRFSVRPGITCLWQIGGRSNVSFERWMELDMQYIDNWSLWLDVKILFKTIPVVLRGTGAA
jgi:exopolysaccharide biosynthesis polyprenyl glycosylphosphotransferase